MRLQGVFGVPINDDDGIPYADWTVRYDELAPHFRTGDLVLQHGVHEISIMIGVLQGSYWSHVGMIARPADLGIEGCDVDWLYLESNTLTDLRDYLSPDGRKEHGGPMAVALRERLKKNHEQEIDLGMAYRRLADEPTKEMLERMRAYVREVHPKRFTDDEACALMVLRAWMYGRVKNEPNTSPFMFCSELIGGCYRSMGLVSRTWEPSAYTPRDFSRNGRVPFLHGAQLVDQIRIDPESL